MRGRKATQIEGIEQYDFDKLAKTEGNPRERRRFLAFAHLREGKTLTATAAAVRVKFRSLMRWVKRFKTEGFEGLKDKPGRGLKPFLPSEHRAAFREAVLELQERRACQGQRCFRTDENKIWNRSIFKHSIQHIEKS
jgi:transposase